MLIRPLSWAAWVCITIIGISLLGLTNESFAAPATGPETEKEFRERVALKWVKHLNPQLVAPEDPIFRLQQSDFRFFLASRRVYFKYKLLQVTVSEEGKEEEKVGKVSTFFLSKGLVQSKIEFGAIPWLLFKQFAWNELDPIVEVEPAGGSVSADHQHFAATIQDGSEFDRIDTTYSVSERKVHGVMIYSISRKKEMFLEIAENDLLRVPRSLEKIYPNKQLHLIPRKVENTAVSSDLRLVAIGFNDSVLIFRNFQNKLHWMATYPSAMKYLDTRVVDFNYQGDQLIILNAPSYRTLPIGRVPKWDSENPDLIFHKQQVIRF